MTLLVGDCLAIMPTLDAESIDAIVTDPPYGLSFMGREWDHGSPGVPFWTEALRVAKPGAHLLAFGGTRTYHRLACAIEDAGWEVRDCLVWAYASGFPKSHNLDGDRKGWGTALKPAWEPIILARKPLRGTVAANVTEYGTGALNIDGCRIATDENLNGGAYAEVGGRSESQSLHAGSGMNVPGATTGKEYVQPSGRWPANLLLTDPIFDGDTEGVVGGGRAGDNGGGPYVQPTPQRSYVDGRTVQVEDTPYHYGDSGTYSRFFLVPKASRSDREPTNGMAKHDAGAETPMAGRGQGGYKCVKCNRWKVSGNPCVCAEPEFVQLPFDRPQRANHHPTVKPVALMRHLVRLVTPPGGTVLDPFLGSGTTALACEMEGFGWVGIEKEPEYAAIVEARLALVQLGLGLDDGRPPRSPDEAPLPSRPASGASDLPGGGAPASSGPLPVSGAGAGRSTTEDMP